MLLSLFTHKMSTSPSDELEVVVDAELKDLIPGFLQRRHEELNRLPELLAQADWRAMRLLGHSLKGNAGGYGFTGLGQIGRQIEMAAIEMDVDKVAQASQCYQRYLDKVVITYA